MDSAKCAWIVASLFILISRVSPTILEKHNIDQRQKEAANDLKAQGISQESHLGDRASENESKLSDNKSNHYAGAQDSGHYSNRDADKKIFDDSRYAGGQTFNQASGEKNHDVSEKTGHKKGHHNSGFRNSYHKDEVSNNSSFFDDYIDENGRNNYELANGRFGNEAGGRYNLRKEDGVQQVHDNSRQGNYDRHGGTDARNLDNYNYDRKRYNDDRRDQSQHHRGQSASAVDRNAARVQTTPPYRRPVYYDRPPEYRPHHPRPDYYHEEAAPRYAPAPPLPPFRRRDYFEESRRPMITIYEDPRIDDSYAEKGVLRGGSEYVELEVRPGIQRYQRFDSFHSPHKDWGVNRRSEINPLVFNYNRY